MGKNRKNVHWCSKCKVRMCTGKVADHTNKCEFWKRTRGKNDKHVIKNVEDWGWVCQDRNLSCWDKFHSFYKEQGLFMEPKPNKTTVGIRQSSQLCINRNKVLNLPINRGRQKGVKNKVKQVGMTILRGHYDHNISLLNSKPTRKDGNGRWDMNDTFALSHQDDMESNKENNGNGMIAQVEIVSDEESNENGMTETVSC